VEAGPGPDPDVTRHWIHTALPATEGRRSPCWCPS